MDRVPDIVISLKNLTRKNSNAFRFYDIYIQSNARVRINDCENPQGLLFS